MGCGVGGRGHYRLLQHIPPTGAKPAQIVPSLRHAQVHSTLNISFPKYHLLHNTFTSFERHSHCSATTSLKVNRRADFYNRGAACFLRGTTYFKYYRAWPASSIQSHTTSNTAVGIYKYGFRVSVLLCAAYVEAVDLY